MRPICPAVTDTPTFITDPHQGDTRRLFDAVLCNDDLDPAVTLPATVPFDFAPDQLASAYALSLRLWREGLGRDGLAAMASYVRENLSMPADMRLSFKYERARIKHLRFGLALYTQKHSYPLAFTSATNAMGHLQDALMNDNQGAIRRKARQMQWAMGRPFYSIVEREIAKQKPSDAASFQAYRAKQFAKLRGYLDQGPVTPHEFHNSRKIISRFRALFNDMDINFPSPEVHQTALYLANINGLMGNYHDELIEQRMNGTLNYYRDKIPFPADMHAILENIWAAMAPKG